MIKRIITAAFLLHDFAASSDVMIRVTNGVNQIPPLQTKNALIHNPVRFNTINS